MRKSEKRRLRPAEGPQGDPFFVLLCVLALCLPLVVLPPSLLENPFNAPKELVLVLGASIATFVYVFRLLSGRVLMKSMASTPRIVLFLIFLNLFSFLYTGNYYYTAVAAVANIGCLLLFHFCSLYMDGRKGLLLFFVVSFAGLLVSLETWLEFYDIFLLFKGAKPGMMVIGTIGNSNWLGAYLLFPLFCITGLLFALKGRVRFLFLALLAFVMAAFLFSRARASWMGYFLSLPLFLYMVKKILGFDLWESIRSNRWRTLLVTFSLIALLSSLWLLAPPRFHTMMSFRQVTDSLTLRLRMDKYFQASWWLFKQNPLFGTGLCSFRNMVYQAQAEINKVDESYFTNYPEPKPRRVHNEYLETLNDGGLLAAAALLAFLALVMRHGWKVIRNEGVPYQTRIITASAFCSILGIMLAAFFFFPFRMNCTLFMTALMMGIVEGVYLRSFGLLSTAQGVKSKGRVLIPFALLMLLGVVWFTGIKPFIGELENQKHNWALASRNMKEAERHILKAIEYDPRNSSYCLHASQLYMNAFRDHAKAIDFIERAIVDFNGDLTLYSLYFFKGLVKQKTGNIFEARAAFEKALYYYPTYVEAAAMLQETDKIIQNTDSVLIKLR